MGYSWPIKPTRFEALPRRVGESENHMAEQLPPKPADYGTAYRTGQRSYARRAEDFAEDGDFASAYWWNIRAAADGRASAKSVQRFNDRAAEALRYWRLGTRPGVGDMCGRPVY